MNVAQSSSKHFSGFLVLRSTRPSISLVLRFKKKVLLEKFSFCFSISADFRLVRSSRLRQYSSAAVVLVSAFLNL